MVFWILFAVIVLLLLAWLIAPFEERRYLYKRGYYAGDIWYLVLQFIWKPAVAAVAAFFVLAVCAGFAALFNTGPVLANTDTYALKALTTDEDLNGRVFLFVGSFSEDSTIAYIREDGNGGMVMREVGTANATIYERDEAPTLAVRTWEYGNPWILPEGLTAHHAESYAFTVPVGSVSSDIEVKP